jgi:signal transduction histidine kinase
MARNTAPPAAPAGLGQRVAAWLALGIDPAEISPDTLRRIRVLSGASFLLMAQGVFSVVEFWLLGLRIGVLAIACAALLALGNLALLRRTRDPRQAAHIALVILTGPLLVGSALSGGIEAAYFSWFYALPVAAAVTLNVRGVLLWLGVTLALTLGFWTLPFTGVELTSRVPEPLRHVQVLVDRAMVLIGLTAIGVSFVTGQRRAERDLARANLELERESTYLRLLMHAAVSANQATSLDEALRECAKSVCHALSWSAGHVYAVNEQGLLVSSRIVVSGDASLGPLVDLTTQLTFAPGEGLPGRALASRRPVAVQAEDLESDPARAELAQRLGLRAGFAVPVLSHGEVVAVVEFASRELLPQDERFEPVLGLVGAQLGRAAERAALEERLRQIQKVEAIAQLAAGLAHEINNPMAYTRANLNLLRADWDALRKELEGQADPGRAARLAECDDLLAESAEGVDRTIAIVRDVRDLAHGADAPAEPVDLEEVVDAALRESAAQAGPGVRLERRCGDVPPVPGSAGRLRQVVVNLLVNAIHATGAAGSVRVATERRGRHALLIVEDDGPGIASEVRERLFEPFFTTKPVGQGTGLGLYVCSEIVRSHGGEIRVDSEPGRGARFEVRLPLGREARSEA